MLRCKACNAQLSQFTLTVRKSKTLPEAEDLCPQCKHVAYHPEILDTSDYAHSHITEMQFNLTKYEENA